VSDGSLTLRPLGRGDLDTMHEVLAHSLPTPRGLLELYFDVQPDGFVGAEVGGALVGVVCGVRYPGHAFVGSMGVRPDHQGRGIAGRLLRRLLDDLDRAGCGLTLLEATDAGHPLYLQAGFVDVSETSVFRRDAAARAPESRGAVEAVTAESPDEVLALDRAAFGTDRAPVITAALRRWPGRAFLARGADGRVAAWILAQPDRIGPWVATEDAAAERVLAAAVALPFEAPPSVGVPAANTAAAAALARAGFTRVRRTRRMRRGVGDTGGQPAAIWGRATLALG
jgi:GNAT superfamily N-acetyltransferase